MKKLLVGMGICCIVFCALRYTSSVHAADEPVATPEVEKEAEKQEALRYTNIPFSDIAGVLQDGTVADVLHFITDNTPFKVDVIIDPAKNIGRLLDMAEKFEADLFTAQKKWAEIRTMAVCLKVKQETRAKLNQDGMKNPKTGKALPNCAAVGCAGSRAECLKKAVIDLQVILRPFIEDVFVGYKKGDKQMEGISFVLLDLVQQPGAKKELQVVVEPLKAVLRVLDVLSKAIVEHKERTEKKAPTPAPETPENKQEPESKPEGEAQ